MGSSREAVKRDEVGLEIMFERGGGLWSRREALLRKAGKIRDESLPGPDFNAARIDVVSGAVDHAIVIREFDVSGVKDRSVGR
jgi:hypothetical protein